MKAIHLLTGGLVLALAGCGPLLGCGQGPVAKSEVDRSDTKPLTLRLRAAPGDAYTYSLKVKMQPVDRDGSLDWTAFWDEKATKVEGETITWDVRFYDVKVTATGVMSGAERQLMQMDGLRVPLTYNSLGHSMDEEGPSGATANVTLPESPVKPGDSWESKMEANNTEVRIQYTFIRRLQHEGKNAVLIEGVLPEGQVAKSVRPGQFILDEANGKILKATAEYEFSSPAKLRMSYEIEQVK
ncbi:MAG TPA: hypothetical protein VM328_09550 [Fimbriimonadaceae bacterium]|nr:hypothetical protein [Fimbriimonadaceae bacterium]